MSPADSEYAVAAFAEETRLSTEAELTCALVDWPVVNNACRVLEAPDDVADPFVALHDLATLIAGLVFYDKTLVVDWPMVGATYEPIDRRAARVLELDEAIVPLDPYGAIELILMTHDTPAYVSARGGSGVLHHVFWQIVEQFDRATQSRERWLRHLRRHWEHLLPATPWLEHSAEHCHERFAPLETSVYNVPHYDGLFVASGPHDLATAVPRLGHSRYEQVVGDRARSIVLDNDVRGLFHASLASALQVALDGHAISVRYLGGCLRTPIQVVLAETARDSLVADPVIPMENWLQGVWAGQHDGSLSPVAMPFWFDAVLVGVKSTDELLQRIRHFRRLAERFRARRHEMERRLADGDLRTSERLGSVLVADAAALTRRTRESVGAAVALADVGLKIAAPTPLGIAQVSKGVTGAVGSDWLTDLTLRLFHPEVRAIHSLGRSAALLTNSLPQAFSLFRLKRADASDPLGFLSRLGESSIFA